MLREGEETAKCRDNAGSLDSQQSLNERRRRAAILEGLEMRPERFLLNNRHRETMLQWERLRAKFPDEDPAAVEQAVADAIAKSFPLPASPHVRGSLPDFR